MIDNALIFRAKQGGDFDSVLNRIAILGRQNSSHLWKNYIDSRQFSAIHQILLGIHPDFKTLEQYTSFHDTPAEIDAVDRHGRSALAWAAEYGWSDGVDQLLRYGADASQVRRSLNGTMPLLHLVLAGANTLDPTSDYLKSIELLIHHGADVNACDHEGWTAYHVAAS